MNSKDSADFKKVIILKKKNQKLQNLSYGLGLQVFYTTFNLIHYFLENNNKRNQNFVALSIYVCGLSSGKGFTLLSMEN